MSDALLTDQHAPHPSCSCTTHDATRSDVHFWAVHRVMHPWGWSLPVVGDVGGLLYRHVHYLHHLRYNPGPWAGLSMHPVEQAIYFSRSLWMLAVPCHPVVFLFSNLRAMIGPAPGECRESEEVVYICRTRSILVLLLNQPATYVDSPFFS